MRIPILTFGAIASILTINSVIADTTITTQGYVDAADALKQNKIPAGTTGNVVTYTGTAGQIGERGIFDIQAFETLAHENYDPDNPYDWIAELEHSDDLVTAGVFAQAEESIFYLDQIKQAKVPAGTTGSVVTYNGTQGGQTQFSERGIYDGSTTYNSSTDSSKLITAGAVTGMTPTLPTGTANTVVMYNNSGAIGGSRGIYDGADEYDSSTDSDKLVTAGYVQSTVESVQSTVETVQTAVNNLPTVSTTNKRCISWIPNASQTDENCLLWNLVEQTVYGFECVSNADCPVGGVCDNHLCLAVEINYL